jgi:hypothetical protein
LGRSSCLGAPVAIASLPNIVRWPGDL